MKQNAAGRVAGLRWLHILLIWAGLTLSSSAISNQDEGSIGIYIKPKDSEFENPARTTVMVTVLQGTTPIAQRETDLSSYISFKKLPAGNTYTVRFEGEDLELLEKHGVLVFKNKTTELKTFLQKGQGTKVIHYSTSKSK